MKETKRNSRTKKKRVEEKHFFLPEKMWLFDWREKVHKLKLSVCGTQMAAGFLLAQTDELAEVGGKTTTTTTGQTLHSIPSLPASSGFYNLVQNKYKSIATEPIDQC